MSCPHCTTVLPERGFFCPGCGKQARCKSCRELLEPGAVVCVMCGVPVEAGVASSPSSGQATQSPNTISYRETSRERTFEANLTDHAISEIAPALAPLVSYGLLRPQQRRQPTIIDAPKIVDNVPYQLPLPSDGMEPDAPDEGSAEAIPLSAPPLPTQPEDDLARLRRVFRFDGDQIRLDETRLKAANKKSYIERLVFLLLYAHQLNGRSKVERSTLNGALKEADLFEPAAITFISSCPELSVEDGFVSLRLQARERAKTYLREVLDSSVENLWELGTKRAPRGKSASSESLGDATDKPESGVASGKKRGAPVKASVWAKKWRSIESDTRAYYDALQGRSLLDAGVVGLWVIRSTLGEGEGKVVSRGVLAQFILEAFEIKVDERSLERVLKAPESKAFVISVGGVKFQVTPSGIDRARAILQK
jgi:RNA polymerase subunit RPABC4/transcription elongation factor Spt4